jgi:integrase
MATRRKKRRNDYVGCSLSSHRGTLRLEWRDGARRVTWSTGEPDTPDARAFWDPTRKVVGAFREQGVDPRPYLQRRVTGSTSPPQPTAPTIRSFAAEWLALKQDDVDVRPALVRDYATHLRTYILPDPIADLALDALRPRDVALFQHRLRQRRTRAGVPLREKSVVNVLGGTFKALLRDAMKQEVTPPRDLFASCTARKWKVPSPEPLTAAEWARVDAWFRRRTYQRRAHPAFHAFVFFLRWHGVRPSEAAGLSWDDVDLHQGVAYVRHSFVLGALGDPKTTSAERTLELHPDMLTLLTALRPLRPAPGAIVFPNLEGKRIRVKTFSHIWVDCLQACRIRYRGIYALKDTFCTHVLAMAQETGEVERLVAWLVRQTGVRLPTLQKHYVKHWPRDRDAIRRTYGLLDPAVSGHIATRPG